jgi:hypothetical protein
MIERILPADVSWAEAFADHPGAALFPAEEAIVAGAVDKRRREFTTARNCARNALAKLGVPPAPILTRERGAPQWPVGMVGSITHCAGYRAAAVARARDILTVGVDAEPNEPLPDGVLAAISLVSERAWLGGSPPRIRVSAGTGCCSARRKRSIRPGSRWPGAGSVSTRRTSPSMARTGVSALACWYRHRSPGVLHWPVSPVAGWCRRAWPSPRSRFRPRDDGGPPGRGQRPTEPRADVSAAARGRPRQANPQVYPPPARAGRGSFPLAPRWLCASIGLAFCAWACSRQ